MPLLPKSPIVVPEITLDKYWIQSLVVSSETVGGAVTAVCHLVPYNDQGKFDYSKTKKVVFNDVLGQIDQGNLGLANVFQSIMTEVQAKIDEE